MAGFTWYHHQRGLERHVRSSHTSQPKSSYDQCGKSFARSDNLHRHMRTCTGRGVTTAVAAVTTTVPTPATTARPRPTGKVLFTLQQKRLSTLRKAMVNFQQVHRTYKFQVAVIIIFHKAVDPTVVTYPPVVLTSEMVAVYTVAAPPLVDVNRH